MDPPNLARIEGEKKKKEAEKQINSSVARHVQDKAMKGFGSDFPLPEEDFLRKRPRHALIQGLSGLEKYADVLYNLDLPDPKLAYDEYWQPGPRADPIPPF